jgi:HAMP domain-containing protein
MAIFRRIRLGTRFTLLLVAFFAISIGVSGVALYRLVTTVAEESVTSNGVLLLHTINAVRSYTSHQVNPLLTPVMKAQDKFIPETVPAFSARSVFGNLRGDSGYQNYSYKEAAINPTAPQDRADAWETGVLMRFQKDRTIPELSGFRTLNGQLVFYNARPMVVGDPACLTCHTTPEAAPPAMVNHYGSIDGFGWKLNDVIAAQIVYVPAAEVYSRSWRTWASVMLISVTSFALAVLAFNLLLRRNVVKPIGQMAELARRISTDEIDEQAPKSLANMTERSDELGQMARVFERMAQEVYAREQSLRQQVQELRIEIDEAKKARHVAQLVNTDTFQDLRAKAQKIRQQRHETGTSTPDTNPDSKSDPPSQA